MQNHERALGLWLEIRVENIEKCPLWGHLGKCRLPVSLKELAVSPAMSSYTALEVAFSGGIFSPFHKVHFLSFTVSVLIRFICICLESCHCSAIVLA